MESGLHCEVGWVIRVLRSWWIGKLSLAFAAAAGVAVALGAYAALVGSDDAEGVGSFTDGRVSILERPAAPADRLPESVLDSSFPERHLSSGEHARFAQAAFGRLIFVAPGKADQICLIVVLGDAGGATCGDRGALKNIPIYLARPNPDGTQDVFGLVADGATKVGDAYVKANTFAMDDVPSGEYEMHSANGSRKVQIGAE